jgi:hypothetical protein
MTLDDCLKRLYESDRVVNFYLTLPQAMSIMSQLQLALRHPGNDRHSAEIANDLARILCEEICSVVPELLPIFELGWNSENDLTREEFEQLVNSVGATDDDTPL